MNDENIMLIYWLGLVGSVVWGMVLFGRRSQSSTHLRIIAAILPAFGFVLLVRVVMAVLQCPFWEWNGVRLAPMFALHHGYALYYPPSANGPILALNYGPPAALAYWPTVMFQQPTSALLLAGLLSVVYCVMPVYWLLRISSAVAGEAKVWLWLALIGFGYFAVESAPLAYSFFAIHADAPSMGLATCAGVLLYSAKKLESMRGLAFSAFFAVMAVWAKQNSLFMVLGYVIYVGFAGGRGCLIRYVACLAVIGLLLSLLFISFFGWEGMQFYMFTVLTKLQYRSGSQYGIWAATQEMLRLCLFPVIGIVGLGVVSSPTRPRTWGDWQEWCRENRWVMFVAAGIVAAPLAPFHRCSQGGDSNAFSLVVYSLGLAAASLFVHWGEYLRSRSDVGMSPSVLPVLAALFIGCSSLIQFIGPSRVVAQVRNLPHNVQQVAHDFLKTHPGAAYFPDTPLAHLTAEGKCYHFSYGIAGRYFAGMELSDIQFWSSVPTNINAIIRTATWINREDLRKDCLQKHYPEFAQMQRDPSGLIIFTRPGSDH